MALPPILAGVVAKPTILKMRQSVDRPALGSVVYTDMGPAAHSGIYVGRGEIVSLSGDGEVVRESREGFVDGILKGPNIYVSCSRGKAVGDEYAAFRADQLVGRHLDYHFILDNCHQFAAGCLTGEFDNEVILLLGLMWQARKTLGATSWACWGPERERFSFPFPFIVMR